MTTKHDNARTETLIDRLAQLTNDTADTIKQAADILTELHIRKVTHPLMRDGVLRYYAEIAEGRLSAKAALAFAGVHTVIRRLIGMPLAKQDAFAAGEETIIATHDTRGEIVSSKKPLLQLSAAQLDIAMTDGKVRPFAEQRKILAARSAVHPPARRSRNPMNIRADLATGEIVCGQLRFTPHELAAAVKALGFEIVRVKAKVA
jgi:hypothetical protein